MSPETESHQIIGPINLKGEFPEPHTQLGLLDNEFLSIHL